MRGPFSDSVPLYLLSMGSQFIILFILLFVCLNFASAEQENDNMDLEQSVCGLKEPFVFWLWSSMAGSPNEDRLARLQNVEDISFETKDNRTLRGYKLKATARDGRDITPKGYLLVLQGNAILADQILEEFTFFSSEGLDVYIYDFRGYGRSEGKRRLKAMISDYTEIFNKLNASNYNKHFIYAMSFGGITFLNGYEKQTKLDRIIIDSTPSRLSDYGCPIEYDPVNHIPQNCSHFMFIVGKNDGVVTPSMSEELIENAQQCGARIVNDEEFAHPFMDRDWSVYYRRMQIIQEFLLNDKKN